MLTTEDTESGDVRAVGEVPDDTAEDRHRLFVAHVHDVVDKMQNSAPVLACGNHIAVNQYQTGPNEPLHAQYADEHLQAHVTGAEHDIVHYARHAQGRMSTMILNDPFQALRILQ